MKNFILFILGLTLLLFASCSDDDNDLSTSFEDEITIEVITLDELNTTLVANGLEPFPAVIPDDLQAIIKEHGSTLSFDTDLNSISNNGSYKCSPFEVRNAGDWNNNNVFSVQDLVIAQQFLLTEGDGFYSGINQSAFEFGQFSSIILGPGVQPNFLNGGDYSLAVLALLGQFCF
jgi:hypothetical protein